MFIGSTKSFVEYIGINMVFQNPLLIIDWRGVLIMFGYSSTHRVSHLRVHDTSGYIFNYLKVKRRYSEKF
jgi:hypothetical protein